MAESFYCVSLTLQFFTNTTHWDLQRIMKKKVLQNNFTTCYFKMLSLDASLNALKYYLANLNTKTNK